MYEISKQFEFCASHQLKDLVHGHPCMRVHGHNYKVVVTLCGETLNSAGMLLDYREMSIIKRYIDETLDHCHLNDIIEGQPSAERMAKIFFGWFKELLPEHVTIKSVSVSETDKTNATYYE